jgi:hypothetical protein
MPATEEMRKMAELQLQEMQITFGGVASEQPESREKPSKKGFFRRHKAEKEDDAEVPRGKIQYKPGTFLARVKKESPNKIARDDTLDPELQKAIALSITDGGIQRLEANQDSSEPLIRSEVAYYRDDEETLQMAMALSLSEAESARHLASLTEDEMLRRASKRAASSSNIKAESHMQLSEEEMLDWALKESKLSASSSKSPKVASLSVDDAMSCSTVDDDNSFRLRLPTKKSSDDVWDKKMPAEPSMARGTLGQSVRTQQPVGTNDSIKSKPRSNGRSSSARISSKSSKVASFTTNNAASYSTDDNDNSFRVPTKKSLDDFSDKKMPAEPSMTRGTLGQSVRKKQPVGTNVLLKSQPRSYERFSSDGTSDSRGSEPRSYEQSSRGGSRRQLAKNESIPREAAHAEPGSPERYSRIGSSRRALSKKT